MENINTISNNLEIDKPLVEDSNNINVDQSDSDSNSLSNMEKEVFDNNSNEYEIEDLNVDQVATCKEKYFSKLSPGSLRGSTFNLAILSLGIALLALPKAFEKTGIIFYVLAITLVGIITYYMLDILIIASKKKDVLSYGDLVKEYYGENWGKFMNVVIILIALLTNITYQIMIYKILAGFFYRVIPSYTERYNEIDHFMDDPDNYWNQRWFSASIMLPFACIFYLPLCLLKDVSKLRFATILGIVCVIIQTLILIIQLPMFIKEYSMDSSVKINVYNVEKSFDSSLTFFTSFANLFFAFNLHYAIFPIYRTLSKNTKRRTRKVMLRGMILIVIIYIVFGVTGYLTQPKNTPEIIINRNGLKGSKDVVMTICRLIVLTVLIVKYPANYIPLRVSFFKLAFKTDVIDTKRNIIVTVVITLMSATIGAMYSNIEKFITFIGGIGGVINGLIFPALLYIRSKKQSVFHWKSILVISTSFILSVFGIISVVVNIMDIFKEITN